MESKVTEEERNLKEQELEKEVHWIQDPGYVTTRATQFVRTQAESWRMKTLLAKALNMQGSYEDQLRQIQRNIEAMSKEHVAILESLDFKISVVEQEVDTITKNLTVLINLLRQTIEQEVRLAENRRDDHAGNFQSNHPTPEQVGTSMTESNPEASKKHTLLKK